MGTDNSQKLLAAGLNAHGQLDNRSTEDLHNLQHIEEDKRIIRILFTCWSSTVYLTETSIVGKGFQTFEQNLDPSTLSNLTSAFGNEDGMLGCLDDLGKLYLMTSSTQQPNDNQLFCQSTDSSPSIGRIALAGNGQISLTFKQAPKGRLCHIQTFQSFEGFLQWFRDPASAQLDAGKQHFMIQGRPEQLVANTATFLLLMEDGEVYSWGDPRYRSLGRSISNGSQSEEDSVPAERPGILHALGGLKIVKVASGGWLSAALSADGVLYLWGADLPGTDRGIKCLREVGAAAGEVVLVDLPGGQGQESLDVLDVGIGDHHVAVVTEGKRLFMVGDNANGQLGLGDDGQTFHEDCKEVAVSSEVDSVVCGPRSTFIFSKSQ